MGAENSIAAGVEVQWSRAAKHESRVIASDRLTQANRAPRACCVNRCAAACDGQAVGSSQRLRDLPDLRHQFAPWTVVRDQAPRNLRRTNGRACPPIRKQLEDLPFDRCRGHSIEIVARHGVGWRAGVPRSVLRSRRTFSDERLPLALLCVVVAEPVAQDHRGQMVAPSRRFASHSKIFSASAARRSNPTVTHVGRPLPARQDIRTWPSATGRERRHPGTRCCAR